MLLCVLTSLYASLYSETFWRQIKCLQQVSTQTIQTILFCSQASQAPKWAFIIHIFHLPVISFVLKSIGITDNPLKISGKLASLKANARLCSYDWDYKDKGNTVEAYIIQTIQTWQRMMWLLMMTLRHIPPPVQPAEDEPDPISSSIVWILHTESQITN